MAWWRILVGSMVALVVLATGAAWLVTDQDIQAELADRTLTPTDALRVYEGIVWRDTVRYGGPLLLALLLVMRLCANSTDTIADDVRSLARRWGRVRTALVLLTIVPTPVCFVVGIRHVVEQVRLYARVHCPPDVVMVSQREISIIDGVRRRTAPDTRLLLVTDEEPWFLNYYLHPRTLFQRGDEWVGQQPVTREYLQAKRIDWVLDRPRARPVRLIPAGEYQP